MSKCGIGVVIIIVVVVISIANIFSDKKVNQMINFLIIENISNQ